MKGSESVLNDEMAAEVQQNKSIRGYILRSLAKGHANSSLVRTITNMLVQEQMIITPDISKHIDYLEDAGYVEFTNKRVNAYTAYKNDAVIKLTRKGVDLLEGTVDDPGVEI